jgi:hypothetical protein
VARAARVLFACGAWGVAGEALAQDPAPTPAIGTPDRQGRAEGAPLVRLKLGAWTVSPTLRIGELALDTNVFYERERRTDFLASGGPGLEIAAGFLDHWRFAVDGEGTYYYFHRNERLRRWGGSGGARLDWKTTGTAAGVAARLTDSFSRPSFEVDARIDQRRESLSGYFDRNLGLITLSLDATLARVRVSGGQEFRGVDLERALSQDELTGRARASLRLTPITSLLAEAELSAFELPLAAARNYSRQRFGVGFATSGLFKGEALGGVSRTSLDAGGGSASAPFFRVSLTQNVGTRIVLSERLDLEQTLSAFAVDGEVPTYDRLTAAVTLQYSFLRRFSLRLTGGIDKIESLGLVEIVGDDGRPRRVKRDDTAYTGDVDLGVQLGEARLSGFARYTTRESLFFTDFGIDGLQVGARLSYRPPL